MWESNTSWRLSIFLWVFAFLEIYAFFLPWYRATLSGNVSPASSTCHGVGFLTSYGEWNGWEEPWGTMVGVLNIGCNSLGLQTRSYGNDVTYAWNYIKVISSLSNHNIPLIPQARIAGETTRTLILIETILWGAIVGFQFLRLTVVGFRHGSTTLFILLLVFYTTCSYFSLPSSVDRIGNGYFITITCLLLRQLLYRFAERQRRQELENE